MNFEGATSCEACSSRFASFYLPYCPNPACKKHNEQEIYLRRTEHRIKQTKREEEERKKEAMK